MLNTLFYQRMIILLIAETDEKLGWVWYQQTSGRGASAEWNEQNITVSLEVHEGDRRAKIVESQWDHRL